MLVRPLFITSFMLADFLQDNAFLRRAASRRLERVEQDRLRHRLLPARAPGPSSWSALTSERNRAFVEASAAITRRLPYDDVRLDPADVPTLYVDFSGDESLRAHRAPPLRRRARLRLLSPARRRTPPSCARPTCPARSRSSTSRRCRSRSATPTGDMRLSSRSSTTAQLGFIRRISDAAHPWMNVVESRGFAAAQELIGQLHAGRTDPRDGHVVVVD